MAKDIPRRHGKKKQVISHRPPLPPAAGGRGGLVVCNYGQTLDIEDDDGTLHRCTARKKLGALVCGDKVVWQAAPSGDGVILALQKRRTLLVRPDSHGDLKPIAANADQLLVVISPRAADSVAEIATLFDTALIDRYLVATELSGLRAVILVNKADLLSEETLERATRLMDDYRAIGYPVLFTSAKHQLGIAELVARLGGHTSVFSGPSGVGKSSLVKTLLPERDIRIGAASASGAGRHTTTLALLYHLPRGGKLIDSPGVRDFALWHASPAEIARGFAEFRRYAPSCRFADCRHLAEPGCAVRQAAEKGEISAARLESYLRMVEASQAS